MKRRSSSWSKAARHNSSRSLRLALEPRMVFDAAIAATIDTQAELLADNNQDTSNADEPNKTAAENVAPAPDAPALSAGDDKPAPAANEILASNLQTSGPVIAHDAPNASQVVFLDGGLPNLDKLESSIPEDVEVVVLDTHGNGVQQITDFLADHTGYSALHIVSHGDSGEVFIGNSVLSDATLPQYSTQLQAWQNSLAPGADLLIYGCDVAAGTNGEHFIAELGRLTGTDVTASTDPTGSARFGGDWVLEAQTGAIDANSIDLGATGWDGELATASFKAIYQGTPSAASLQASNITLSSKLDANASSIKFISADPSTTYFSGNNVAGKLVYTDSSNVVHSIDGVISRQFKTGGTTNAFYFYAIGADGLVNTLVRDGGDDTAYLLQVNNDTTTYTYDNSASAMYRTSSDPVDTALNSTGILASAGPSLTAATSSSANASPAIEAGGISNGTAGQNGTGNVLDASLAPSGLSVISVGTSAASQSGISASTTSSTGTSVTGTYGTLTLGSDGTYKYVVDNSNSTVQALRQTTDTLTDTFTYTAKDGSGNIASTTLSVTIQGKNDAPVANSDYNTAKIGGTAVTGNVLGNDTDVDKYGETLSTTGFTATADLNTYTAGNTSISYSTSNGISSANGAYVFYLAGDGKYYPLSTLATASGSADGITVTVGGSSPNYTLTLNHDPLNYTIASGTRLGFANTWSSSFTPGGGTKYADVTAATSTAQITLKNITGNIVVGMTVTGTNIPDGTTVASISGTGITFNKSPTGTPGSMTFSAAGGATITGTYGTLVLNADGKGGYTYSPNASGSGGTDTFTYKMQDLSGATSTSTLNIQVLGASSTLTTVADTKSITVGTASVSDNVTTNDSSTGGTESVITGATAQAALGTTQTITSGSYQDISGQYGTLRLYSTGAYTYTLNTDAATTSTLNALGSSATLTDSFQYLATNATAGAKSAAALTITINGANDAPTLKLNTSGSGSTNFATSFTQGDTSPAPLATLTGAHIADVDDIYFSKLTVSFTQSNFADGSSEQLLINGASVTISGLGTLTTNSNLGSFTLGGVSYSYGVAISGGVATLSFNPTNAITKAQTETLLTALRYQNSSTNPTAGSSRVFSISVTDNGTSNSTTLAGSGTLTSSAATSTITVYNTSTAPIASVDTVAATEAGGTANGTAGTDPTGNVLTGETSNSTGTNVGDSGSSITVTKAQTGSSITGSASTVTAGSTSTSSGTSITGTYGTLVIGADGSYKYTVDNSNATVQALQQSGSTLTDTFSYQITDNASRTATAALTVTINGANDAPTVGTAPTNQTATVGTAFSYTVPAFSDVDTGDTITYSASGTLPAGITFDAATRTFSGTPTATQSAQTITITGTDSKGATVTTTFTLTAISASSVSASNDTASATEAGGTANGTAGTDPTGNVKTNDTGTSITVTKAEAGSSIDGSASTVAASSTSTSNGTSITGTYGTLVIGADGSYKYTVNNSNSSVQALQQGSTLTDTFSYQITDNASQTATATLTVTINGANDAPTVGTAPTNQTATVGTAFSYTVPAFSDVDTGDTITYSASGTLPAGITFDAATRTFSGTPTATQSAQTITVTGTDSKGATVTTTFTLAATNPSGPSATADTASATEAGGTANGTAGTDPTGNVKTNDTGTSITVTKAEAGSSIDGSASTVAAGSTSTSSGTSIAGTYGTLVIGADGSYKYTVNNSNSSVQALQQGSTLTDTFSYQITDNASQTATATLTVTINGANDAPTVGTAPTNQTATVGTAFSYTVPAFSDVDTGDTITYSASGTLPAGITFDAATRTFSGTPTATQSAQTITVTGTDSKGATVTTTFTLAATNPSGPSASNDTASATEAGGTANGTAGTDPTGDVKTNDTGTSITVTKAEAEAGNSIDGSASAVAASSTSTSNGTSIAGTYGTLVIGADGSYKYTVNNSNSSVQALQQGSTLTDTFSYQITDNASQTATATLTVTINGANDAPTVGTAPTNQTATVGTAFSYTVPAFSDVDTGDTITYSASGTLPAGITFDAATRTFSGTPTATQSAQTITVTGTDSKGATVTTTFTLTAVSASAPAAPSTTNDTATATEAGGTANGTAGTDPTGNVKSNDTGTGITVTQAQAGSSITGSASALAAGSTSASNATTLTGTYGTLVIGADGSYSYTVNNNNATVQALQQGGSTLTDTFSYQITDNASQTATATLTVTISGANDAPMVGTAPTNQTATVGTAFSYTVPAFSDVDTGDSITYSYTGTLPTGITFDASSRTFSGTPTATQSAQTITITGTDSKGATVTTTFTLAAANPGVPTATADTVTATEAGGTSNGTAGTDPTGNVKTNDTGTSITVTKAQIGSSITGSASAVIAGSTSTSNATTLTGSYGTLVIGADGSYSYTVNNNNATVQALQQGGSTLTDTFSYQIADNASQTSTATLTITINGANDAPTVGTAPTNQTATVGTAFSYTVPAFSDVDTGDSINYSYTGTLPAGITFDAGTRTFSGTPTATQSAQTITITGTDSKGVTVTTTFTLASVNPLPPVATADTASSTEAGGVNNGTAGANPSGNVKSNDTGTGITVTKAGVGGSATSSVSSGGTSIAGSYGTLVIDVNGNFNYTLDNSNINVQALQVGSTLTDTFSYQISDIANPVQTATTTLTVTINGANDAPTVGTAPTNQTATVGTEFSYTVPAFNDVDNGDTITYSYTGTLPPGITFDPATHMFSGIPTATQSAQTITVTGTDSKGATVSTTFTLNATNPLPPVAKADTVTATEAGGTANGTAGTDPAGNVMTNDTGTGITVTKAEAGGGIDGNASTVAAASNTSVTRLTGTTIISNRSSSSTGNGTSITGAYGSLLINADGSFKYTLDNSNSSVQALQIGSTLTDTFSYQITDKANPAQTAATTLTVTINGADDAPTVGTAPTDQTATVGTAFSYTVPAFSDVDTGDTITYSASGTLPAGITFDPATRTFSGTPTAILSTQTITIIGTDSQGATVSTTFTFGAINPPPPTQTVDIVSMTKDTGSSPNDFITGDGTANRLVSGTLSAVLGPREVVQVSFDDGNTWVVATTIGTNWSIVDTGSHDANWDIQAKVVNTITSASGPGSTQAVIYDPTLQILDNTIAPGSVIQLSNPAPSTTSTQSPTSPAATSQGSSEITPTSGPNSANSPSSVIGNADAADGQAAGAPLEGMLPSRGTDLINFKLELTGALKNQLVLENKEFSFRIPNGVFTHTNPNEQLDFKATSASGGALPSWLHFDPNTKTFSGIPPVGSKTETVLVVVRDSNGKEVRAAFTIGIDREEDVSQNQPVNKPKPVKPQARQSNIDVAPGKSGLTQQIHAVGRLSRLHESQALLNSLKKL